MKIEDGSLRIRSARTATRYLGAMVPALKDEDEFVDTRDMLELQDGRYQFAGRKDGVINIGGTKVYPEEVEAVINQHPDVQMSLVRSRKNSLSGALVIAEVVLKPEQNDAEKDVRQLRREIVHICREDLAAYKVPVSIYFVPALTLAESGKLMRHDA